MSGAQLGDEPLLDPGLEGVPVDGAAEDEGRDPSPQGQAGDEGAGLPVAVGCSHPQALAAWAAPVRAGHVGLRPGLVEEDQPRGIEVGLPVEPGLPAFQDVRAILLAGMAGLFLRVMR